MNGGLSLLTGHGSIGGKMGSVLFFCSERGGIGQVELTHQKQRKQRERCAGWCCLFLLARPFFYFFLNSPPPSPSCIFVSFIHIYIYFKNSFLYLFQFSIFLLGTSLMVTKTIDRNRVPPSCQRCGGYTVHVADVATTGIPN